MTRNDLLATHADVPGQRARWQFWRAAYEGPSALIEAGVLRKYATEDDEAYKIRLAEAVGLGYSRSIIRLYAEMLKSKPVARDMGPMATDPLWLAFVDDCDQFGASFYTFLLEQQKAASVHGHVGILVDKPALEGEATPLTREQATQAGIYPYLAAFLPDAILDWRYERRRGRPVLAYLKLLEAEGTVLEFDLLSWRRWALTDGNGRDLPQPELAGGGEHGLPAIPWVWLVNQRTGGYPRRLPMGVSDLTVVAQLDVSILRNLSHTDAVAKHAAFPMLLAPTPGPSAMTGQVEIEVGPQAVLPFDPREGGESKPSWLESAASDPIGAILGMIEFKRAELYRAANVGGLQTEATAQVRSGVALRHEFQLLNSVLAGKAEALEEAELGIIGHWLAWQGQSEDYGAVTVAWPRDFGVEDLASDLATLTVMQGLVPGSPTFQVRLQEAVAARLPAASEDLEAISKELEEDQQARAKQREALAAMTTGMDAVGEEDDEDADGDA